MFYCKILLQRTGSIFDALVQRTDGCTDVQWLLVQIFHSIRCSHKRYTNRHLSQHMRFWYCDEGSGQPVQMFRLARDFSAKKIIERSNRFWMLFHGNMIT